jgi:DeoR/GlpR family transcriptional regulator of sugar metabolism
MITRPSFWTPARPRLRLHGRFDQFSADKLFLSGAGCDLEFGVSGANLEETMVNRAMLRIAREILLVAEPSKFSRRSMSRITPFSEIDTVISDKSLGEDIQTKVRALGCSLILASQPDSGFVRVLIQHHFTL